MTTATTPRLKARYREEIVPELKKEFSYGNIMQVPGLSKIVVNMGVGEAARDSKLIEGAVRDLTDITGQKPQVTKLACPSLNLNCVRDSPLVHTSHFVATACGSSSIACSAPRCHGSVTSGAFPRKQFDGNGNYHVWFDGAIYVSRN